MASFLRLTKKTITLRIALFATLAFAFAAPSFALGNPSVALKLSGAVATKGSDGVQKETPLGDTVLRPGETIRYRIAATNKGDRPALRLVPVGKIPVGTSYEVGSASGAEFSINGGKTWSARPMITVHTPAGDVVKAADPATYTSVRWPAGQTLAPNSTSTYSYAVLVK